MTFGPVNVSFSLPKWQAVKMTFFAPCLDTFDFSETEFYKNNAKFQRKRGACSPLSPPLNLPMLMSLYMYKCLSLPVSYE